MCVGEGREKFGHVFLADTGTSNGDISGQSRPVNTCDFKQSRPFRIITGSEDNTSAVYEGPPFKFKTTKSVRIFNLFLTIKVLNMKYKLIYNTHMINICCYGF